MLSLYGYAVAEADAIDLVQQVLKSPIRAFDTSNAYSEGESERRIGAGDQQSPHLAPIAPRAVHERLEAVHRRLAEDRRDRALDVLGQQGEPGAGGVGCFEQALEDERLAEHRGGLAHGQRGVLLQRPARDRERRTSALYALSRDFASTPDTAP